MSQPEINFGKELKEKGISVAVDHAESVSPGWKDEAFEMFKEWLRGWPEGYKFLMEDARVSLEARGLPSPPSLRAYGWLIVKAKKCGLIAHAGYAQVKNKLAHQGERKRMEESIKI